MCLILLWNTEHEKSFISTLLSIANPRTWRARLKLSALYSWSQFTNWRWTTVTICYTGSLVMKASQGQCHMCFFISTILIFWFNLFDEICILLFYNNCLMLYINCFNFIKNLLSNCFIILKKKPIGHEIALKFVYSIE